MKKIIIAFILSFFICFYSVSAADDINLNDMIDSNGAVMLIINPETGAIIYVNNAAVSFYGYTKNQLLSMNISQINTLTPEETGQEMQAAVTEQRNYFEFRHRLANGEIRTVEVYSYPVKSGDRNVLFTVVHDITEKVILQEKEKINNDGIFAAGSGIIVILGFLLLLAVKYHISLKLSKNQIEKLNKLRQTFIDADDNLVYLKDENLKYVFINKAYELFSQKKADDIIGFDDYALTDYEFAQKKRMTDRAVLEKETLITDEIQWNGRIYKTTKFPVRMPGGKTGVGAHIRDITDESERLKITEKSIYRQKILLDVVNRSFQSKQEQLDYVLHQTLELTDSQYGFIYIYNDEKQELTLCSWTNGITDDCIINAKPHVYQLNSTNIWSESIRQRRPVIINEFKENDQILKKYPKDHVKLDNFMSVPVIIDDKIAAVIGLANKAGNYDDHDIYEMTILMNGVWNAVERREKQETILYERNKYRQTIVSIGDGVLVVDNSRNIEMINHIAESLTGWTLAEAYGRNYKEIFEITHANIDFTVDDPIQKVFETDSIQETESNAFLHSKNGNTYNLEFNAAPVRDDAGFTVGVILVFRDMTEKKEQSRKIEYLSFHDSLTGLYNRRFFENELRRLDTEENLPISIIMGDVNGLKLTNDIFGHLYGDELLEKVAHALKSACRPDDIAARWGGDEFVILLPHTGSAEADIIISKMKDDLSKERIKAVKGSISAGAETKYEPFENILYTLGKAEEKMYTAKALEQDHFKNDVLESVLKMLHENNPREKQHSARVSVICEKMGNLLGLNENTVSKLKRAGTIHDIGKIILETDLLKNDAGTAGEEGDEFKKHPITGYRILNAFDQTADLSEIILAHHEHWDGSGYPKGLKREEIPFISRIISIVESYERRYTETEEDEEVKKLQAAEFVRENGGKLFDPALTEIFIKMIENE